MSYDFFFDFFLNERMGLLFFFFFQAEDGIRDLYVTGVQTCALPIWGRDLRAEPERPLRRVGRVALLVARRHRVIRHLELVGGRGARRRVFTDPARRARRPAAVRPRHHRPDRVRGRGRVGARVRAGPGPARRRRGAPATPGRGAHRAGLDAALRAHDPAVNVYFHTFGCKANQYDTELVRQAFADQGATAVDAPDAADLAVVNSCT